MNQATALDHVGIVGRDLGPLAVAFETAGFHLTPMARHAGGRTGNRCAMLREGGYLELMSTIDNGTSATLDRFLARHAGAHILALRIDDEDAVAARLRLAWDAVPPPSRTDRAVDDAEPNGPRVRFSLITPPDPPEGRVHLIRHETPDALWQDRFLHHPNNAVALEEIIVTVPEPAVTAAWYSVLAGRPVVPDPCGGYALPLPRGRVRLLPGSTAPHIASVTIRTSDGGAAARDIAGGAIQIEVAGVTLRFC